MDPQVCLANARKFDPDGVLCSDARCNGASSSKYLNARCHCSPPFQQNPCPYTADSPVWVNDGTPTGCYCCCSCFAHGTLVAYGAGAGAVKPIEQFVVGDTVLVATSDLRWEERAVEFSAGLPPDEEHGKTVITVYYELNNEKSTLVVTPDHIFFMPDKQLKRAKDLTPGVDQLVNAETGAPVAILGRETGGWWLGLHHIATTDDASHNADYHLLNSNGVITGDWALQVAMPAELAAARRNSITAPGVQDVSGRAALHHLQANFDPAPLRHASFVPYSVDPMPLPPGAQSFFTAEQAEELLHGNHVMPLDSISLREPLAYVFRQLHFNYPQVFFDVVWEEDLPNVYSFIEHGVQFVVMSGGMARLDAMTMSGLYMVAASATGRLVAGQPFVPDSHRELSCRGQADYFATLAVLRNTLFSTDYRRHTSAGTEVLKTIFGYLVAGPDALLGNRCNQVSTDCRMQAFEAGSMLLPLPWCAGGPRVDYLQVKSTRAIADGDAAVIEIRFNQDVNQESACEPENYGLLPAIAIASVSMLPGSADTVVVRAQLKPLVYYTITLANIMAADGDTFRNDQAQAKVRLPGGPGAAGGA